MEIRQLRLQQQAGIDFINSTTDGRAILDHGMSVGKTLEFIRWWMTCNQNVLTVVPIKSIPLVWEPELIREGVDFSVITSTKPYKVREALRKAPFVLVNYEKLRLPNVWKTVKAEGITKLYIIDECHRIKDSNSKTTRALYELQKTAEGVVGGTGTLYPHDFMDIHGQMKVVDPFLFDYVDPNTGKKRQGIYKSAFIERYADYWVMPGTQVRVVKKVNPLHAQELADKIATRVHTVHTEDVVELPDEIDVIRNVELPAKIMNQYQKMEDEYIIRLQNEGVSVADNILTKIIRLRQITSGYLPYTLDWESHKERLHVVKAEAVYEILDEASFEPVIVFFNYTPEAEILADTIRKYDKTRNVYYLDGTHNDVLEWNKDDRGIIIVQTDSGSESIDLTHAGLTIFFGYPKNVGKYKQARARTRRSNSEFKKVRYYHVLCKNTIDEDVYEQMENKIDIIERFRELYLGRRA